MNQQVNKLAKAVNKLAVNQQQAKQPKKKKNRKRKQANKTPGASGFSTVSNQGLINFSRTELLGEISTSVGSFDLEPSSFPFLKGLASHFELYKWLKMTIVYKPAVGTTVAGAITIGIDWSNLGKNTTRSQVATLTPMFDVPVWQTGRMVLPSSRLQTRKEYILESSDINDKQPAKVMWAMSASQQSVGDIWVEYSIQLFGTK